MNPRLTFPVLVLVLAVGCNADGQEAETHTATPNEPTPAAEEGSGADEAAAGDEGEAPAEPQPPSAAERGGTEPAAEADPTEVPPIGSETAEEILASIPGEGSLHATIVTNMGTIECTLYEERAPNTVANFVGLATGRKTYIDNETEQPTRGNFYDGLIFHRVIPDFMIQGGDPTGTGAGGPGYRFPDEFHPLLRHTSAGTMSMANSGPNTNGSQFFVCDAATGWLDDRHSVFGTCENHDVIARLARVPTGPANRPLQDVIIERIVVERR